MILLKVPSLVIVQPGENRNLHTVNTDIETVPHEDCPLYLHSRLYGVTSLTKRHSEVKTEEDPAGAEPP